MRSRFEGVQHRQVNGRESPVRIKTRKPGTVHGVPRGAVAVRVSTGRVHRSASRSSTAERLAGWLQSWRIWRITLVGRFLWDQINSTPGRQRQPEPPDTWTYLCVHKRIWKKR